MAAKSFKDWVFDDLEFAEQQGNEIENNISLEEAINKEQNGPKLRRSERIKAKREQMEVFQEYNRIFEQKSE